MYSSLNRQGRPVHGAVSAANADALDGHPQLPVNSHGRDVNHCPEIGHEVLHIACMPARRSPVFHSLADSSDGAPPMRFMVAVLSGLVVGLSADSVLAQIQEFPYQAVVVKDDVLVRSGGNDEYYPTMRIQRDTVVTVKRHDTGGWYMIAPPGDSFNWIPARYVDRTTDDAGVTTEDHVIAFVGSEFGDEMGVWQGRLAVGTPIEILEQREVDTKNGPQSMFRIAPPARDRRWIPGDAVIPVDQGHREKIDSDPFSTPTAIRRQAEPAVAGDTSQPRPSARLQRIQKIRSEQRRLAELDDRFRNMIRQNPTTWDLQSLEADYTQLRDTATWRPVAGQIDLRFPAIDRYLRRQAEYEDFNRLTSETERRDAELLSSRTQRFESRAAGSELPAFDVAAADSIGQLDVPGASMTPTDSVDSSISPSSDTVPFSIPTPGIRPASRYIGAGIIQRMPDGGFVLTSPSGKKLAQVKGNESVALDEFVGKQVGLHGQRWYREDIRSDFIEATGLEPVRINN